MVRFLFERTQGGSVEGSYDLIPLWALFPHIGAIYWTWFVMCLEFVQSH